MRIAVVGATGMLGRHVAHAILASEHELILIHRGGSSAERLLSLGAEQRIADLDQPESWPAALKGVDVVIQCAGFYPRDIRPWQEDVLQATQQMQGFYTACAQLPSLQKVVYLGAAIALPRAAAGQLAHADLRYSRPPTNLNSYIQVKWALDELALEQAAKGLPLSIAIPSMTFGEYDYGPSTGQLLLGVARAELPGYVAGQRNVIAASDAGRGILAVAEHGRSGQRYLLTGHNTDMDTIVELAARWAQQKRPKRVPLALAQGLGAWQRWRYRRGGPFPQITPTALAVMSAGQHLDGGKVEVELGFRAQVDLQTTVTRALQWFAAAGYLVGRR